MQEFSTMKIMKDMKEKQERIYLKEKSRWLYYEQLYDSYTHYVTICYWHILLTTEHADHTVCLNNCIGTQQSKCSVILPNVVYGYQVCCLSWMKEKEGWHFISALNFTWLFIGVYVIILMYYYDSIEPNFSWEQSRGIFFI